MQLGHSSRERAERARDRVELDLLDLELFWGHPLGCVDEVVGAEQAQREGLSRKAVPTA